MTAEPGRPRRVEQGPSGARLWWLHAPRRPALVVLLLHGRSDERRPGPPSWRSPVVLRMLPLAWSLQHRGGRRVAVGLVRYGARGWVHGGPVRDARWALGVARERYPERPLALVGHSMGGRAALRTAGERGVESVVTLAAWVQEDDVPRWSVQPRSRLWLLHGADDTVTSPRGSQVAAERFAELGAQVKLDVVPGEGHAMLGSAGRWHRLIARWLLPERLLRS